MVCIKPESEMVNGFDGENFLSQGRKINNRQRALKHKKLYVIILSHEKKKSEIPAPYALLSNRNLKTNPFPSRPLPQGDPFWGQKTHPNKYTPMKWMLLYYDYSNYVWTQLEKKRIKKKETLSRKKIKQKASPL